MDLRDYQAAALDKVRDAVRRGIKRLILAMPTGAGKTKLAAEIVNGAQGKKKRVIFEVPAISLVDQTLQVFYDEGIRDVGVIQAKHEMTDWSKPIQIASVQTLMRRNAIPEADVVIRDECHKFFKFDADWMAKAEWSHVPFIGLSATPWTKGLGKFYQELIIGTTTEELISWGYLSKFRVFAPTHPDLKGVRIVAGDYHEGDLSTAMNKSELTADIVGTWKMKAEGRPTICFAVDRAHAKALQEKFIECGIPAGYMDCETPLLERQAIRRQFERGDISVVCNVDVIGMGVDWPEIGCISYCRPTRSEMRFVQNIGRGLRKATGKDDLIILDHSDTSLRLGFVTDIHHERLSTGKESAAQEKRVPLPKECKQCSYLKPAGVRVCPNCGHEAKVVSRVETAPGELQEFQGKKRKYPDATMEEKAVFYAELKGYGAQHHYKEGWASNKFKEKFGVWPDWSIKNVTPRVCSWKMASWIKSRNIAWAKSKKRSDVHEAHS